MQLSESLLEQVAISFRGSPQQPGGIERRREPRTAFSGNATIILGVADTSRRAAVTVMIRDLSSGGIGIRHTCELPLGERFILLLPPAMTTIARGVLCQVTNCRRATTAEFDIGAMFLSFIKPITTAPANNESPGGPRQPSLPVPQLIKAFREQLQGVLNRDELRMIQLIEERLEQTRVSSAKPSPSAVSSPSGAEAAATTPQAPLRTTASQSTSQIQQLLTRDECIKRAEQAMQARTLSGVVAQVISLAASPRSDLSDIASLVARDPLLSARILQAANSVSYTSTRGLVSTIPEAVRNIGCSAVRDIAASLGVFDAMPPCSADGFNPIRCWQHSFAVATLCQRLSPDGGSGLAYLTGLCHDLGEILFHTHFGTEYRQVLEAQEATGKRRDELERKMLGMTHGEMVLTILRCLGLPETISNPIEAFHYAGAAARTITDPTARVLRVADLYANGVLLAASVQAPLMPLTRPDCRNAVGDENPNRPDAISLRSEIYALTAMLARMSAKDEATLMTAPYPHRKVRVWLTRDPSLSSFDPIAAALESMGEVTLSDRLPTAEEQAGHQGIVVVSRSTGAAGLGSFEITKLLQGMASSMPLLWITGRIDGPVPAASAPILWPVPLSKLAEFVTRLAGQ